MERVGAVRTVLHIVALEPLGSGGTGDVEELGGLAVGQARVLDFLPDFSRRAGLGHFAAGAALPPFLCYGLNLDFKPLRWVITVE
jgi:hypothetical protein